MTLITLRGEAVNTAGKLPEVGESAPDVQLVDQQLGSVRISDYRGERVVLNIFPSVDTGICAASVRRFNELAAQLENTRVLCISRDLPFALGRFCGAEGIERVTVLSDFRSDFGEKYGVTMVDGPLRHLLARAIVVLDADGTVIHTEQVPEIGQEPDYAAAIAVLNN